MTVNQKSRVALDQLALAITGAEMAAKGAIAVVNELQGQFNQRVDAILSAKGMEGDFVYKEGELIDRATFLRSQQAVGDSKGEDAPAS